MVNHFKLSIASLLTAGAVSLGGIGVATLITNNFKSASADVASVYAEDDPSIGVGEANKATVTVTNEAPVTLTLNEGVEGQYFLTFMVENASPEVFLGLTAQVGENYYDPAYNSYLHAFITNAMELQAGTEIILTNYTETAVTVDVYLTDLFMGASTDNAIYGLLVDSTHPKTAQVENIEAGSYIARLQTYDDFAAGTKFYVQLDEETPVELVYNLNMYGYVANVTFTADTKTITVSTDSETAGSVDLNLIVPVTVTTPLPETAAVTFTQYEPQSFVYKATGTGYFTIKADSTPANAEFGISYKLDPNYLVYVDVYDDTYPIYMVEGESYYFDITYTGVRTEEGEIPETASAKFVLANWLTPTIAVNEVEYVPVTVGAQAHEIIAISGIVGTTYNLGLTDVPYDVESITAHYSDKEITLNAGNGFTGEITIEEGVDEIYFVADYTQSFISRASLYYQPVEYDDEIHLDTLTSIELRPGESRLYFVYNLPEGEYKITLTGNNGSIVIGDVFDDTLVAQGSNEGFFNIVPYEDETTGTAYLNITNNGTTTLTFNILVAATPVKTLVLGETQSVTLGAGETQNYEITLTEGFYTLTLAYPDGSQIEVKFNGETVEVADAIGILSVTVSGNNVLSFTNLAETEVTFTVTVTALA